MAKPVNQIELADLLAVDPKTVRVWQDQGCPVEKASTKPGDPALYLVSAVVDWRVARAAAQAAGSTKDAGLEEARRRKEAARAEAAELDLAVQRGDLVAISSGIAKVRDALTAVRTALMGMGARIAPRLEIASGVAAKRAIVDEAVTEALHDISRDPRAFLDRG